jgi:hypothetical protein
MTRAPHEADSPSRPYGPSSPVPRPLQPRVVLTARLFALQPGEVIPDPRVMALLHASRRLPPPNRSGRDGTASRPLGLVSNRSAPVHLSSLPTTLGRLRPRGRYVETIDSPRSTPSVSRPLPARKLVPGVQPLAASPVPQLVPEIQLPLHAYHQPPVSLPTLSTKLVDNNGIVSDGVAGRQGLRSIFFAGRGGRVGTVRNGSPPHTGCVAQKSVELWNERIFFTNIVDKISLVDNARRGGKA